MDPSSHAARRDRDAGAMLLLIGTVAGLSAVAPNQTLGFITQMYVLGSIIGTGVALYRYRRAPDDTRWAIWIGAGAFGGALIGSLIALIDAIAI